MASKAKNNFAEIRKAFDEINRKEGKGTIITLDSEGKKGMNIKRISTCIDGLDYVLGGGLPLGRQIEISGEESAGKTTLAHYLTSLFEMAVNHPVEGTFSWDRAELMGNTKDQLYVHQTETGESYMNKILKFAQLGTPIQVVDSVPWLEAKAEVEKRDKAARNNTIEQQRMSPTTQVLNPYIARIGTACELSGAIVIWVNQVRQKMNAMPFGDQWMSPGGKKFHHANSIELRVARKQDIKIKSHDPRSSAPTETIGIIMTVKCIKNKTAPAKDRRCELVYLYDRGFIAHDDLKAAQKEIEAQKKQYYSKEGNYRNDYKESTVDDWDSVEEIDEWDELE